MSVRSLLSVVETVSEHGNKSANRTPIVKDDEVAEAIVHACMTFFAVLSILFLCVIVINFLLNKKLHFIPEALAVMILGCIIAIILKYVIQKIGVDVKKLEDINSFHPNIFFLVLLPPIIFESGYTLQKGDFFSNIGAILTYALLGTVISAVIVGLSLYGLGEIGVVYKLNLIEAFSFGSLISATDPVCTLALFQSMNVDQDLYAIVFGESVLNDAVSIVLTMTLINAAQQIDTGNVVLSSLVLHSLGKFCLMLFVSSIIGVLFGLASALIMKYARMDEHPSLEVVTMIIFAYMPYGLSEGFELSGIMAILLCGITMSHYTHFNLSPLSQIAVQQIFRVMALVAETMVFVYLGMAILNGKHVFDIGFVSVALLACLVARAVVVFPLALFFIFCRSKENRISLKILFLIWFSGLRGAVAFAQSLHLPLSNINAKDMIMTTTLSITVVTNVILGVLTLPLVKFFNVQRKSARGKSGVSKSLGLGRVIGPSEASSQVLKYRERRGKSPMSIIRGWRRFDKRYLMPFFIRSRDSKDYQSAVTHMIDRWAVNEERVAQSFLTSSAEIDENSPLVVNRTRRNIIRPVRKLLRTADDRTEDESDSSLTPSRISDKVRFNIIAESDCETEIDNDEVSVDSPVKSYGAVAGDATNETKHI